MNRLLPNSFFALSFFILNLSPALAQQDSVRSDAQELSDPWQLAWQKSQQGFCKGTSPCLIQAFISDEDENAVPIDRIVISDSKDIPALMLPKGTMWIVAVDKANRIINEITENFK